MNQLRILFLIILVSSCTSYYPEAIEEVIRQAGKNRKELEKVLKHYGRVPADSLKLRAAEFLIVNMPEKYSIYYDAPWNDVSTVSLRWTSSSNKQMVLNTYQLGDQVRKDDVNYITADYLINNIDMAFKAWQDAPWGHTIPFDVFCEEILPYRVGTEPLENWRKKALASFADPYRYILEDSTTNAVTACTKINSVLPRFRSDPDFPEMNYSQLMSTTRGTCDDMAALAIFAMRSLGIPVTFDFTPKWPNMRVGHSWCSVTDSSGVRISFMPTEVNPGHPHMGNTNIKNKTYRHTFAKQTNIHADDTDIPPALRNRYIKDVSSEDPECIDIEIPVVFQPFKKTGYAYLAVLYEGLYENVAWGIEEDSIIKYSAVGKNILYFPTFYQNNKQSYANFPFWLDEDGVCHFLQPDTAHTEKLSISEISSSSNEFMDRMLHGRFEGANSSDFSDAKFLYAINKIDGAFFHSTTHLRQTEKFRYIRYLSPEGGWCNVAEIEFYGAGGKKLNGTVIGTLGSWTNSTMTRDKVFDGDVTTYFDADIPDNAWVGLDLGEPAAISKIRFLPRFDDRNSILEGQVYEWFYWDGQNWLMLERQTATDRHIICSFPSNALLFFRNVTNNKTGNYFYVKDGVQKWL